MSYLIVILLVLLSGLFSGLTLGLLRLDTAELKRKISLGNKKAEKVYAVRKKGNLLLCTLLLGNVAVNSALAVFLGEITSGVLAGLISTALIVVFGEIIPQATFSKYALDVGAKTAWMVQIVMIILYPICAPIAWILDKALGAEMATVYSKKELIKIVEEHEDSDFSDVDADEERIIKGALSFSERIVEDIMTPRTVVFALEENTLVDDALLDEIRGRGFTRIPVYREQIDQIVGILYVKDLLTRDEDVSVKDVYNTNAVLKINEGMHLDKVLNMLIKAKLHLAFVYDEYAGLQGVVTLEDIIEEILKTEIVDESDTVVDLQKAARRNG